MERLLAALDADLGRLDADLQADPTGVTDPTAASGADRELYRGLYRQPQQPEQLSEQRDQR
ncbi:hypothetical protein GXW82_41040 [Streptacidiphilus sp. 4-A2]|nr:hypothetical protein [Streptacidiphilus sp. 4-A2]